MTELNEALGATRAAVEAGRKLRRLGWSESTPSSVIALTKSGSSAEVLLSEVPQMIFDSVTAVGQFGEASLSIVIDKVGNRAVTRQSPVDALRIFGREMSNLAADAWAGDVHSALALPGTWTVRIKHDRSALLSNAERAVIWHVLSDVSAVESLTTVTPFWSLGPTWDAEKPVIYVVEDLAPDEGLWLGRSAVVPLLSDTMVSEAVQTLGSRHRETWSIPELPDAAHPDALAPARRVGNELADLEKKLWIRCATMSWVCLASSMRLNDARTTLELEVFGLQRVAYPIGPQGIPLEPAEARRAYEMFRWAHGLDAVDQRLAVQQVASLYRDVAPWNKTSDVFDAATAVFATLRRDAVGEVILARRSARTLAIDIAHRTSEQTSAAARSAVERGVATLLAIGGVIVANTTGTITDGQAQNLRSLLGFFLLALIVWNVTIEGPSLSLPLRALRKDLSKIADMLTEAERKEVRELNAVTSARRRAIVIRVVVPLVYLAGAIAAWTVR
ncbi:hypothetical protein [Microbacterium sp. cx-59]|uniref:hypothetical protein n=1 Tax=Microbacterium sp. cx-59 TaxID=2891207 RepID=UPI001E55F45A|nr:hypothetical protein [Microbacterium sp. cx-59]MCC4906788.1 hypothetical protein [Microbacterium sp. cx-59]